MGKSSLVAALSASYAAASVGFRSSPLIRRPRSPGDAVLGDPIRMGIRFDPGVYFRSMSAAGEFGCLAATALEALEVLRHRGYDDVLLETVGVGQNKIDAHLAADVIVLVLAPAPGDDAQAGILEIADVVVINKAGQVAVLAAVRSAREAVRGVRSEGWYRPVLTTVASRDEGVTDLGRDPERARSLAVRTRGRSAAGKAPRPQRVRDRTPRRRAAAARTRRQGVLLSALASGVATGITDLERAAIELLQRAADGQRSP